MPFHIRTRLILRWTRSPRPGDPRGRRPRSGESGHLMAAVVAMTAIMAILATVAAQEWSELKRRDDEAEMIFRARDLARAMVRYRLDKGNSQPLTELDMLLEPGTKGQYFVRQLWEDPLVKNGKWGLLYQGPGGQVVDPNAPEGLPGDFRLGEQSFGNPGQPDNTTLGNAEMSGLPIVGVKSLATDQPFREINSFRDYSEWKFTIFDEMPGLRQQNQAPGGGNPGAQPGAGGGNRQGAGGGNRPGAGAGAGNRPGGGRVPGRPRGSN